MRLMKRFIQRDCAELHHSGVRLVVIGERDNVDPDLLRMIEDTEGLTAENNKLEPGDRVQLWRPPGNHRRGPHACHAAREATIDAANK